MKETLLAFNFILVIFNLSITVILLMFIGKVEKVVENIKELEDSNDKCVPNIEAPKTNNLEFDDIEPLITRELIVGNFERIQQLKDKQDEIDELTKKHNLDKVIQEETRILNEMIVEYAKLNPQTIAFMLEEWQ